MAHELKESLLFHGLSMEGIFKTWNKFMPLILSDSVCKPEHFMLVEKGET